MVCAITVQENCTEQMVTSVYQMMHQYNRKHTELNRSPALPYSTIIHITKMGVADVGHYVISHQYVRECSMRAVNSAQDCTISISISV